MTHDNPTPTDAYTRHGQDAFAPESNNGDAADLARLLAARAQHSHDLPHEEAVEHRTMPEQRPASKEQVNAASSSRIEPIVNRIGAFGATALSVWQSLSLKARIAGFGVACALVALMLASGSPSTASNTEPVAGTPDQTATLATDTTPPAPQAVPAPPPKPAAAPAPAKPALEGPVTRLPIPRYVSLKGDEGNVRRGPSQSHRIDWVFRHAGMPLRVVGEFEHWRRIEDHEGAGGWIHYSLLSSVRTAIIEAPIVDLRSRPDLNAAIIARAESGAILKLDKCNTDWCRLQGNGVTGWSPKTAIWGVDADEIRE